MFYLKPCRVGIIKDVAENPKGEQEFEGVLDRSCVCRSQQVTPGLGRGFKKKKNYAPVCPRRSGVRWIKRQRLSLLSQLLLFQVDHLQIRLIV